MSLYLYESISLLVSMSNDITVNECLSTKSTKAIKKNTLCTYHISQSPYTANQYMTHSNIR